MLCQFVFNEEEVRTLKSLARLRSEPKLHFQSTNWWGKQQTLKENNNFSHYIGLCGEYGVAKHVKGFFDPMPSITGDRDRPDVVVGQGMKIAVKTTQYDHPPILKITHLKEIRMATHLALCLYQEPVLKISWIKPKTEFLENCYQKDFSYGVRYCLDG